VNRSDRFPTVSIRYRRKGSSSSVWVNFF